MCVGASTTKTDSKKSNDVQNGGSRSVFGISIVLSPAVSLPILVFIDMFAVALVVPLLFQYYKKAGVRAVICSCV